MIKAIQKLFIGTSILTMLLADGRIVYQDDTKVVVNCDDNRFGNRLLLCLRKG